MIAPENHLLWAANCSLRQNGLPSMSKVRNRKKKKTAVKFLQKFYYNKKMEIIHIKEK